MKHAKEVAASGAGSPARNAERIADFSRRLSGASAGALLVILVSGSSRLLHANEATSAGQWNIMVVPGNQTIFSGQARERFEKNCASCHSKDGRAQTPVARQRHVQDLSECKLTDNRIVEQILRGTHDKTVDFKMPPFNEKLTRAEIESLVPVVKAFRPVLSADENHVAANPRLAGIINFPYRKSAVLEKVAHSGRYFLLNENESHDGIQLAKLMPDQGAVRVWVGGQSSPVTLRLHSELTQAGKPKRPGFLRRLFDSSSDEQDTLELDDANTDLVLFLYAQFTGRTLLRSPRLPATSFSLNASGTNQAQIARSLGKALAARGITMIEDGEKFLLVVPSSRASAVKPRSAEIKSPASNNSGSELFPGGAFVNFPNTDVSQVAKFCAELTGRALDKSKPLPANQTVNFTTQTALSKAECAYALETLLRWHDLKVVPVDGDASRIDSISGSGQ